MAAVTKEQGSHSEPIVIDDDKDEDDQDRTSIMEVELFNHLTRAGLIVPGMKHRIATGTAAGTGTGVDADFNSSYTIVQQHLKSMDSKVQQSFVECVKTYVNHEDHQGRIQLWDVVVNQDASRWRLILTWKESHPVEQSSHNPWDHIPEDDVRRRIGSTVSVAAIKANKIKYEEAVQRNKLRKREARL